jgi:hypothetical protein
MTDDIFKKKQLNAEVERLVNSGFKVNDEADNLEVAQAKLNWEDLDNIKNEIGKHTIEFIYNVNSIITNEAIVSNLKDKKADFDKLVNLFFTDIKKFSENIAKLRVQHEGKTGPITTMQDYNTYNNLAIQYHYLYSQISTLLAPTVAEIVFLVGDIIDEQKKAQDLLDPNVVSDAIVKN